MKTRTDDEITREADQLLASREAFIGQWGAMGGAWGINRTMAQIHALLLTSVEPMTTDEIMTELKISRGNANTNLRDLVGWGLIRSLFKKGDRKEYFEAETDIWKMFCIIARERKRREIEPAVRTLRQCISETRELDSMEAQRFKEVTQDLEDFITRGELLLDKLVEAPQGSILPKLLQALSKPRRSS